MDRPRRPPNNPPDNRGKSATIAQHYYPEGGYGHIIVLLAFIVFLITSGLQFVFNQAQYEVIRENLKTFVPRSNFRKSSTSFYSSSYATRSTASPTLNFTLGSPSTTSYVRATNSSLIPSLSTSSPTWPGRNSSKIDPQLSNFNVSSADPDEVLKGGKSHYFTGSHCDLSQSDSYQSIRPRPSFHIKENFFMWCNASFHSSLIFITQP